MKKLLLFSAFFVGAISTNAQTNLFSENFEGGGAGAFTLNTSDLGGATNSTQNYWIVNNSYTGGSGTLVCLGFPFTFSVANTQTQPGAITNSPNSYYAHIAADAAVSSGITCGSYIPADGTCAFAESHFIKMTNPISTVGFTNVTIDFWWICGGSSTSYGELYYSTDNGVTWLSQQTGMFNQTTWTTSSQTNPAWSNQANLRFGFRFVNNVSSTGSDPGLGVDEISVTGTQSSSNSITTSSVSQTSWCEGTVVNDALDFTSTGTFNAGNVYTAQLSDAAGSFASPTAVGTLNSSASGPLSINITIPGSVPAGTGYRLRVVSSNPATTGSDNGADLTVNANPTTTLSAFSDVCVYTPSFNLTGGLPGGGTYSGPGVSGGTFDPSVAGVGTHSIVYTFVDGNGCSGSSSQNLVVDGCAGIEEKEGNLFTVYPNPVSESFVIQGAVEGDEIQLIDMNGRLIRLFQMASQSFSVEGILNGTYFLRITRDNLTITQQLVINR